MFQFKIGTTVKVVKPSFEGQDPKRSRVGQIGKIISYSAHGMPCVSFPPDKEDSGWFMNDQQLVEVTPF